MILQQNHVKILQIALIIFLRSVKYMKLTSTEKYILVVLFFTLMDFTSTLDQNIELKQPTPHRIDMSEVEKQQYRLEEQFKKQQQKDISRWIVEQINYNQQFPDVQPYESVTFLLKPNTPQIYRIPVSLTENIMVELSLFQISNQGLIILPEDPSQKDYVQVSTFDENKGAQLLECKVYISRVMQLKFAKTHKYLKLTNKASHPLIATLGIEQEQLMMQIVLSDKDLSLTNKKMHMILSQTKNTQVNREHLYKWQWGFYEKHERHQADMLGFTGAELLVIITTSIVQMYCIKNLINNELII